MEFRRRPHVPQLNKIVQTTKNPPSPIPPTPDRKEAAQKIKGSPPRWGGICGSWCVGLVGFLFRSVLWFDCVSSLIQFPVWNFSTLWNFQKCGKLYFMIFSKSFENDLLQKIRAAFFGSSVWSVVKISTYRYTMVLVFRERSVDGPALPYLWLPRIFS